MFREGRPQRGSLFRALFVHAEHPKFLQQNPNAIARRQDRPCVWRQKIRVRCAIVVSTHYGFSWLVQGSPRSATQGLEKHNHVERRAALLHRSFGSGATRRPHVGDDKRLKEKYGAHGLPPALSARARAQLPPYRASTLDTVPSFTTSNTWSAQVSSSRSWLTSTTCWQSRSWSSSPTRASCSFWEPPGAGRGWAGLWFWWTACARA